MQSPLRREADAAREVRIMDIKIVTLKLDDEIRMERIILDRDRDDALEFVKELLGRITAPANMRMKNHLDK